MSINKYDLYEYLGLWSTLNVAYINASRFYLGKNFLVLPIASHNFSLLSSSELKSAICWSGHTINTSIKSCLTTAHSEIVSYCDTLTDLNKPWGSIGKMNGSCYFAAQSHWVK